VPICVSRVHPWSTTVSDYLICFQAGSSGKGKKLLHLYKLLQELMEEEKRVKQQVRQSEAEVTRRCPHCCQSWSGVETGSADWLPKHPQHEL